MEILPGENGINCKGGEWRRVEVFKGMIIELLKG
jgi:hypothetical protein